MVYTLGKPVYARAGLQHTTLCLFPALGVWAAGFALGYVDRYGDVDGEHRIDLPTLPVLPTVYHK